MTKEKAPVVGAGGERNNFTPALAPSEQEIQTFCETIWPPDFELPDTARIVVWTAPNKLTSWVAPNNGLPAEALAAARRGENTYLGIAAQDMRAALALVPGNAPEYVRGKNETALALAALPMDLDVRGGAHAAEDLPETEEEALAFVAGLPLTPTVVTLTGHGVQAHWCFREPFAIATEDDRAAAASLLGRWNAFLNSHAARHKWKVDATIDLARVMRIPGTVNIKGVPVLARIHACNPGHRYNPADFEIYLPEEVTGAKKRGAAPALTSHDPVPYGPIRDGCAWIRHCEADAKTLPEPQWYGAIGIWGRCVDGLTLAHEYSAPYPKYSERETDSKLAHALADAGPVTCGRVDGATGGKWCRSCPRWGQIKSPVNLATPLTGTSKRPKLGGKVLGEKTATKPPELPAPAGQGSAAPAPAVFVKSDTGNAERLVARFGKDIKWCPAMGWLTWDGERWQRDETRQTLDLAKHVVREIYADAAVVADTSERENLAKHALKSESRAARENMVALAISEPGIAVRLPELDADPWAFNVQNGVIDLRTGKLRLHRREDLITKLAPVVYGENAPAPRWLSFLEEVLPDPDVRAFMQRFVGYGLTGVVREHVLPILWGVGANGKSTFLEAVKNAMGDFALTANPALLMAKSNETHPTERASLLGRRLALCMESEEGKALAEVMVKALTGGDSINARFMRQDEFNFQPTHKLVLATNHRPRVKGTDTGIWRRIMLVPFTVVIPEERRDPALPETLRAEAPGILAWAVAGCLAWQRDGLRPPAAVREATTAYRQDEDTLAGFLAERCFVPTGAAVASQIRVRAGELHEAFSKWCESTGTPSIGQRSFAQALAERGFERAHGRSGWSWCGLRLLTKEELGEDDPELETAEF